MADIKITDIDLNGNDLFNDDEGFMDELGEETFDRIKGGTIASPPIGHDTEPIYDPYPSLTEPLPFTMVIL